MRTQRWLMAAALAAATVIALLPDPAGATPVFSRKYGFECTNCHSAFPRLNDWGQQFRDNGYQIPGSEKDEKTILEGPAPFAMRTAVGYLRESFSHVPDSFDRRGFKVTGLDVLSDGVIGPHLGYELVAPPQVADSRGVEGQDGQIESASVIVRKICDSPWFNLRVGRFEPAYTAFSVKRQLSISPYEAYDYGPAGVAVFSDAQEGLEVTGYGHGFHYAAGYLNGSGTNLDSDNPSDVYARAAVVLGPGEGQTAGQRIGVSGYLGKARPDTSLGLGDRQTFSRLGIDASLNYTTFNLAAQYLYGRDDKSLWGATDKVHWSAWFAELSWQPRTDCVAFARYDRVVTPDIVNEDIARWTGGVRYYLAGSLALHAEYSQQTLETPAPDDPTQETTAVRLDFAF